jgi:tetrahydromethanopterin S-methyltransferase subunit A
MCPPTLTPPQNASKETSLMAAQQPDKVMADRPMQEDLTPFKPDPMSAQRSLFGTTGAEGPASVSICTLADDPLKLKLERDGRFQGIIIGGLHTENLGIEHIISYCLQNPHIRYIVVCGEDGQQAIGHLAGQSFIALAENGTDEQGTILGAKGKRPILKNLTPEAIQHFRKQVTLIDAIGETSADKVFEYFQNCLSQNTEPYAPFEGPEPMNQATIVTLSGWLPEKLQCDKSGYFIIRLERDTQLLILEHYQTNGVLSTIIQGKTGPEVYHPAVECGLVSRLDHAAYLGRELQRAEWALQSGEEYIQDLDHGEQ